jgi:hypothetical protein
MSKKFLFSILATTFILVGVVLAAVPGEIAYQGVLRDSSGKPLTGSYSMVFTIYDSAAAGTDLWHETQTVAVTNGLYNIQLGSVSPITPPVFSGVTRYLGIKVGTDAEMAPRIPMITVPFAFRAAIADSAQSATIPANISVTGVVTAAAFSGDGSALTGITAAVSSANADKVDGIHASSEAKANYLFPLDSNKTFTLVGSYEQYGMINGINQYQSSNSCGIYGSSGAGQGFGVWGNSSGGPAGVFGVSSGGIAGVEGSGQGTVMGGFFTSQYGYGLAAEGWEVGIEGRAPYKSSGGIGVRGVAEPSYITSGATYGGYFSATGDPAIGVYATAEGSSGYSGVFVGGRGIQITNSTGSDSGTSEGTIRYESGHFYGFTSTGWKQLD